MILELEKVKRLRSANYLEGGGVINSIRIASYNLTGRRFAHLEVLYPVSTSWYGFGNVYACRCDCGRVSTVSYAGLWWNHIKKCVCGRGGRGRVSASPNSRSWEGREAFKSWRSMFARCYNRISPSFLDYGAIGVKVSDRWNPMVGGSFENFLTDMGERPEGTSLGRIGDLGNYEPGNCSWQTPTEQGRTHREKNFLKTIASWIARMPEGSPRNRGVNLIES